MKIKKGDNVIMISGKDRGKRGKVLRALPEEGKIMVEGVNMRKKHVRPKKAGQKGQVVDTPSAFPVSNAMVVCSSCKKGVRVGYTTANGKKSRVCKKCGTAL